MIGSTSRTWIAGHGWNVGIYIVKWSQKTIMGTTSWNGECEVPRRCLRRLIYLGSFGVVCSESLNLPESNFGVVCAVECVVILSSMRQRCDCRGSCQRPSMIFISFCACRQPAFFHPSGVDRVGCFDSFAWRPTIRQKKMSKNIAKVEGFGGSKLISGCKFWGTYPARAVTRRSESPLGTCLAVATTETLDTAQMERVCFAVARPTRALVDRPVGCTRWISPRVCAGKLAALKRFVSRTKRADSIGMCLVYACGRRPIRRKYLSCVVRPYLWMKDEFEASQQF